MLDRPVDLRSCPCCRFLGGFCLVTARTTKATWYNAAESCIVGYSMVRTRYFVHMHSTVPAAYHGRPFVNNADSCSWGAGCPRTRSLINLIEFCFLGLCSSRQRSGSAFVDCPFLVPVRREVVQFRVC